MISCVEVWDVNLMVGCASFSLVRRALSESGCLAKCTVCRRCSVSKVEVELVRLVKSLSRVGP